MARMSQMVECRVGGDTARPRTEIAGRIESLSRFVDAPERFHGEILGNAAVTDDANSPGVDFLLVRSKQRFEGFKVARREPFQQFHLPLSIPTYWFFVPPVTFIFQNPISFSPRGELQARSGVEGKRMQNKKARTLSNVQASWFPWSRNYHISYYSPSTVASPSFFI